MYYTDAGPESGTLSHADAPSPIPVRTARDGGAVVGSAKCVGWLRDGEALWRLRIDRAELPGLWVVADREFRPAQ